MSGALARLHMAKSRSRARRRMDTSALRRLAITLFWCLRARTGQGVTTSAGRALAGHAVYAQTLSAERLRRWGAPAANPPVPLGVAALVQAAGWLEFPREKAGLDLGAGRQQCWRLLCSPVLVILFQGQGHGAPRTQQDPAAGGRAHRRPAVTLCAGTSACPNGSFYCRNRGHQPLRLNASMVDDQLCGACCSQPDALASPHDAASRGELSGPVHPSRLL